MARARFIFVPFLAILLRILQVYNKTSEFLLMRSEKNEITTHLNDDDSKTLMMMTKDHRFQSPIGF